MDTDKQRDLRDGRKRQRMVGAAWSCGQGGDPGCEGEGQAGGEIMEGHWFFVYFFLCLIYLKCKDIESKIRKDDA